MQKTIIVTGASRGIGQAIAQFLLHEGHNIVVVARTKTFKNNKHPNQVRVLTGDLADLSIAKRAIDLAISEFGRIDGLVINHAVFPPATKIADSKVEDWKRHFNVNLFSAVALARETMPALRQSKGCIILTSSGAAVHAYSTWGAYGASKAAMNSLGRTIAAEEPDVTTLSIAPGVVDTEMQRELREVHSASMDEKDAKRFHDLHKEGGLLKPEQPGHVMARLVLDPPKELTGEFLPWNSPKLEAFQDKQGH